MKKSEKGLTLIELIFSIVLLTIILLFLYVLINNILFKEKNNEFDDAINAAMIIESVNEDLLKYGLAYNTDPSEIFYQDDASELWSKIVFNTINDKSILSVQKNSSADNKYKIKYLDTSGKEYVWELGEKMYPGAILCDGPSEIEGSSIGNIILRVIIPIYSTTGTYNVEGNNDYKDDIIIEYYGTPQKKIYEEISNEEIKTPTIESSDGINTNELHKTEFSLTAKDSGEDVIYYWISDDIEGGIKEGPTINISKETSSEGVIYTAKACPKDISSSISCQQTDYIVIFQKETIPIEEPVPDKPKIVSSDNILSGNTHSNNFYLNVDNPQSDITYKWSGATTQTGTSIYISEETTGSVYYLEACNSNGCSLSDTYTVILTKNTSGGGGIVVSPPSAPTITSSDGISSGTWHTSAFSLSASSSNATYYVWSGGTSTTSNSISVSSNTNSTVYNVKACNSGGCSSESSYIVKLDTIAPSCSMSYHKSSSTGDNYPGGWTKFTVYIVFDSCSDNLTSSSSLTKGVTSDTGSVSVSGDVRYISKEGVHSITATVKDAAGNKSTYSKTIKIDKTAPSCTLYTTTGNYHSSGGASGSTSDTAVYVELSCSDSLSGIETKKLVKSYDGTEYTTKMKMTKSGTASYSATDVVGNSTSGSKSVTINTCTDTTGYGTTCPSGSKSCTSGYYKKVVYSSSTQTYSYGFSSTSAGSVKADAKPSGVTSCSSSNVGKYKYVKGTCYSCVRNGTNAAPSCSRPSNNTCKTWYWKKYECQKIPVGYTNYKSGTASYTTSCTDTTNTNKGKTSTYTSCTSGYKKYVICK